MDTDTLISKVFLRPAIWDKRLKVYTNRAVVDNCWREISGEMEVPGEERLFFFSFIKVFI